MLTSNPGIALLVLKQEEPKAAVLPVLVWTEEDEVISVRVCAFDTLSSMREDLVPGKYSY